MNTFVRITGNFIIAFGFLVVIAGILTIFGFGNFLSDVLPLLIPDPTARNEAFVVIPWAVGGKIILDGLIYMAAGEFLVLFVDLVQNLKKIAEK
jgi:hypothetical protein